MTYQVFVNAIEQIAFVCRLRRCKDSHETTSHTTILPFLSPVTKCLSLAAKHRDITVVWWPHSVNINSAAQL